MKYTTKSCPYCGYKYQILQVGTTYYGSPFRECKKCGKTFIDKDGQEMACLNETEYKPSRISNASIIISSLGVIHVLTIFLSEAFLPFMFFGIMFLLSGLCMICYDLFSYDERCQEQENELHKSEQRLSDPEYSLLLMQHNFYVPPKYKSSALRMGNAKKLCECIWSSSFYYQKETNMPENLGFLIHIWTSFYCSIYDIVKTNHLQADMNRQFVNTTCISDSLISEQKRMFHILELHPLDPLSEDGLEDLHSLALFLGSPDDEDFNTDTFILDHKKHVIYLNALARVTSLASELFPMNHQTLSTSRPTMNKQ